MHEGKITCITLFFCQFFDQVMRFLKTTLKYSNNKVYFEKVFKKWLNYKVQFFFFKIEIEKFQQTAPTLKLEHVKGRKFHHQ